MSDFLDLVQHNEHLASAVDKLIMSRIEITVDDLDSLDGEHFEIYKSFLDKYVNDENIKKNESNRVI